MSGPPSTSPPAGNKQLGVALFAVLALVGTLSATQAPPVPAGEPSSRETPDLSEPDAEGGAAFSAPCRVRFQRLTQRLGKAESLVVTLPDPIDTHFARELDLMMAALVRGLGEEGYLPDLACLPWRGDAMPAEDGATHREQPGVLLFRKQSGAEESVLAVLVVGETPLTGAHPAALDRALRMMRERLAPPAPGGEPEPDGDRGPTSPATRSYGPYAPWPRPAEEAGEPAQTIRVLGPTFSGSADSLNDALRTLRREVVPATARWDAAASAQCERDRPSGPRPRAVIVTVISPSASDHALDESLGSGLDQPLAAGAAGTGAGADAAFQLAEVRSMVIPDPLVSGCLWNRFVPDRLGLPTRFEISDEVVAKLEDRGLAVRRCLAAGGERTAAGRGNSKVALLVEHSAYGQLFEGSDFEVVQFPMHVWRLRELYAEQRASAAGGDSDAAGRLPELDLKRRPRRVPTFGGDGTLASQDMMLSGLVDELARRRFEVVGVVASDVLDRRFLIERLQELAPGIRIVTLEGDVLLARRDKGSAPAGVLVVSSFPIARPVAGAGEQRRDPIVHRRLPFDAAQGIYYGVRELLTGKAVAPPPTVWLSAVGGGGFHTLERISLTGDAAPGEAEATAVEAPPPALFAGIGSAARPLRTARGWALLLGLMTFLLLVALVHVGWCLWEPPAAVEGDEVRPRPSRPLFGVIPPEIVLPLRWKKCRELPSAADRALHALVVLLPAFVGVPYLVLSLPVLTGAVPALTQGESRTAGLISWSLTTVPLLVLVLLTMTILYLLSGLLTRTAFDLSRSWAGEAKAHRRPWRSQARESFGVVLPLISTLALIGVAVAVAWIWTRETFASGDELLVERSLSLGSGVSPLLPWVLFGGVLMGWIVLSLYRHRVRQAIPTREELGRLPEERSILGVRDHVARLRQAIDPGSLYQGAGVLWTLLVGAPLLYLMLYYGATLGPPLRSIENAAYDRVTSVFFLLVLVVAVAAGISLFRGWTGLRGLLEWLRTESGGGAAGARLGQVREAYLETEDSRAVAERRRKKALETLRDVLDERPEDELAVDLRRRLSAVNSEPDEVPTGRWLAVVGWRRRAESVRPAGGRATEADGGETAPETQQWSERLLAAADEFFLWSMVRFVRDAFLQLLQLMGFMTVALVAALIAVTVYPFEPRRVLLVYVSTLVAAGVTLSVVVILQARQKKLLHAVEGREGAPWRLVAGRLGVYAGLPLVSIVASRFPELRRILVDWVAPLFKTFQ